MSETEPGATTSETDRERSRSRRMRWLIGGGVVAVVVLAAAGFGVWYQFFRDDAPEAVTLEAAVDAVQSTTTSPAAEAGGGYGGYAVAPATTAAEGGSASETTSAAEAPAGSTAGEDASGEDLDGTWQIDTSIGSFEDFSSTFVGYRVDEELASIGAKTAVGRTPAVTGSLEIAGTTISAADFEADLTQLDSDDNRRDGAIRRQAIETDTFPTASFVLTEPIELPSQPAEGEPVELNATGELTIHGVTNTVEFPLDGQLVQGVMVVTGQLPIEFADYGIEPPSSLAVLNVEDNGIVEVQLFLTR